jgi:hypothetical protein
MTENMLKLNSCRVDIPVVGTRQKATSLTATDLQLADATVPFSITIKSLVVYLDSTLSMQPHISFIIRTCFFIFYLCRILNILCYLTGLACVKLVISLMLSLGIFQYAGIPALYLGGLQCVPNCAARLVLKKKITPPSYCDRYTDCNDPVVEYCHLGESMR